MILCPRQGSDAWGMAWAKVEWQEKVEECGSSQDSATSEITFSSLQRGSMDRSLSAWPRGLFSHISLCECPWGPSGDSREVPQQKLILIWSLVLAEVSAATHDLECVHVCMLAWDCLHRHGPTVPSLPGPTCHCFCQEEEASPLEGSCPSAWCRWTEPIRSETVP